MADPQESGPLVAIVDDQRDVRTTIGRGLGRLGYRCHPFASGKDLLDALDYLEPDCVLLDFRMPQMDGMETLRAIPAGKKHIPVIFFTSHGDIPLAVQAMKSGAVDFVEKPGTFKLIAEKIDSALSSGDAAQRRSSSMLEARERVESLTPRELQVMELACQGLSSRDIADQLGLSVRTIDSHRYHAIGKLGESKLVNIMRILEDARSMGADTSCGS
jgi:FixJ family two-component response regulator